MDDPAAQYVVAPGTTHCPRCGAELPPPYQVAVKSQAIIAGPMSRNPSIHYVRRVRCDGCAWDFLVRDG
jgi:hypothetical protein